MENLIDLLPGVFAAITTGIITLAKNNKKMKLNISPQIAAGILSLVFAILIRLFEAGLSPELQELILSNALRIFTVQLVIYEVFIGKRGVRGLLGFFAGKK